MRRLFMFFIVSAVVFAATSGAFAQSGAGGATPVTDTWPREFKLSKATLLVYQPQIDTWEGDILNFRAVLGVKPKGSKEEIFGVIWGKARTQVDRVARMVLLDELTLTESKFPTLPDNGAAYMRALATQLAATSKRIISLDRLEASLAASGSVKPAGIPVNNTPPTIFVSYSPALLVMIDGSPVLRPVPNTQFERVINTHALILRQQGSSTFYLHVYDGWLFAGTLDQPWYQPMVLPAGIDQVAQSLGKSGLVDLIDGGDAQPKPSLANGVPTIYVSETPAELLMFKGQPAFAPIEGTSLSWASNTANDVLFEAIDSNYYVLLSGRWYRSLVLTGPWTYVPSTDLPADFRQIPADSPAGIVLAAVAGTAQAQEAVITNSIPQTATVPRSNGPTFQSDYDGPPQLQPIAGTPLQYVVNSPAPVIQVDAASYYALLAGVWFYGTSVNGPWYVAPSVPAVIYNIPAASPLHYVTYVRVYGSTAQVVYVGYTPGYLGTVVTPDGVVVYGTGYTYQPWVGTVYYAPPVTYGVMAQPVYNPMIGMTFGFAMGVATASATYSWGATPYYHPAYYGGYPCCGSASANVYGHYGSTAYSGTRTYYSNPGGTVGTTASGSYKNTATGTTGSYAAGRSYNPYTGQQTAGYGRTFNTTSGVSGGVAHGATYNPQTGTATKGAAGTATGPGGTTTSAEGTRSANVYGQQSAQAEHTTTNANTGITKSGETTAASGPQGASAQHSTTVTDTKTGQSKTYSSSAAKEGNTAYADHNGNVYKNSGSGWQQHTSSGWQSASKPPESVQKEAQARSQGDEKYNNFRKTSGGSSGWAGRSSGGGGWGGRSGGFGRR
ncbi:MAG: autotransporter [Thermodesulfovibrionales bacterium]